MARTGILRRVGIGFMALIAATTILGGCSGQKKELAASQAESTDLRQQVATLEEANKNKDMKLAELNNSLTAAQAQLQARPTATDVTNVDPMTPKEPKARRTSGGSDEGSSGGKRFTVSGDVLFDPGQATLKSGSKKALDKIAAEIKSKYKGHSVRVEGHTDSDPIKRAKFASNEALSEARAESVRKYLISKGVSAGRVEAVGYGSSKPKGSKAASRRVDIVVLGK
jgi:flagellar motor protein MotB